MPVRFQYFFSNPGGYTAIDGSNMQQIDTGTSEVVLTYLSVAGDRREPAIGVIEDHWINKNQLAAGDSQTLDELSLASEQTLNVFLWDEQLTSVNTLPPGAPGPVYNLYGANRYGMAGGGTDQAAAIDIFRSGQTATYNTFTTLVNLSYNAANGGVALNTHVTMIGGPGRDLFIGGENSDTLYGGDSGVTGFAGDSLGDGLTGGGGDDVIYGGINNLASGNTRPRDDLYGMSGRDTMYGDNSNDFFSGDSGDDVMYGASINPQVPLTDIIQYYGGDGNDTIYASTALSQRDYFYGGNTSSSNVFVENGNGQDTGVMDVVSYNRSAATVVVDLRLTNGGSAGAANTDRYVGIEGAIGSQGNDTLFGSDDLTRGNFLNGWSGRDSVYGGSGNDTIVGHQDALKTTDIVGWDGTTGSTGVTLAGGSRIETQDFVINGGLGTDTLIIAPDGDVANTTGSYYNGYVGGAQVLTGIEIIIASAGADVINLTNGSNAAHSESVTIFANNGADVVFSGSGSDLIVGDETGGTASTRPGADTLFGGDGNDTIWGDFLNLPDDTDAGGDTLYGGQGNDTIFGAGGNDTIYDTTNLDSSVETTSIDGGGGADRIDATFANAAHKATLNGGLNSGVGVGIDANDYITTHGSYESVGSTLGLGPDTFIGSPDPGLNVDVVYGGDGNDLIAGWVGADILYGGNNDDVLWGGAGSDTIYGGAGTDVIYPDLGGANIMYGGTGIDYYYVNRNDGTANQIWDEIRGSGAGVTTTVENYLVINPVLSQTIDDGPDPDSLPGDGDNMVNGTGVFEADDNIMNATGMVQITERITGTGHDWTINVISGVGTGTTVNFDDRDITQVVLWNNDNTNAGHTLQIYSYNSTTHVWFLSGEF